MPQWVVSYPERLDVFLASEGRMPSRAQAQKAIEGGMVRVNDAVTAKAALRLQEGDTVALEEAEPQADTSIEPVDLRLEILYEDDVCIVVNKPAGIAVQPGAGMVPGEWTLLCGLAFLFGERRLPFSSDAVLVHRLDKDTTGCLLIAKNSAVHRTLQKQFETRTVRKQYLALVAGVPEEPAATIDAPIGRSAANRTTMAVTGSAKSREARTTYRVLGSARRASLLLCDLHTGRTHQVRVHLSAIGHPVLGDGTYRSDESQRLADDFAVRTLCLHAWKLAFVSPADGGEHAVTAPLPFPFLEVLERVGIPWRP